MCEYTSELARVCVCMHMHVYPGAVRRPGHMRETLFMWVVKKNHAAPRHDG